MIGKVMRGRRVAGLLYYLYGPGRANEHVNPHIVAGWRHPAELEPALRPDGGRDFRNLTGLLNQPLAALGHHGYAEPVWHCVARAAREDRILSDDEWANVAQEIMNRTGLGPADDDDGVRWVAVRHADDHIHIVATLARQDGTKPKTWNDFYRVREACQAIERRYGLRVTAPGDRTAARRPTRSETEQARRRGWKEVPRVALRRQVITAAAGAASEDEFFRRLEAAGVLVRQRMSQRNPGEVTGYAVALPTSRNVTGEPVWFGGGKLAADLTLPKLRARWSGGSDSRPGGVSANERRELWEQVSMAARQAAAHIREAAADDPHAVADLPGATSDLLHIAARLLKDRRLRDAAEAFDRAAREPYARIPRFTRVGLHLRRTVRMLANAGSVPSGGSLVADCAGLVSAVADLRAAQKRMAQAVAARAAAQYLNGPLITPVHGSPVRLAVSDFPEPIRPHSGAHPRSSARSAGPPSPPVSRRPHR
ncbi:relaxase/mobilization nuclease domain-containing protein [Planotetraspora sp. A-T 1434]|uniref:relaxase/mobilization nuclease domain-containing protein n=1 Tax=Planotetraspora sp. A-T 1434 TaxID=2979219 RepID=UPI0021C1EA34|nr:relaxase/mobilization nuclease domain-containing protein [Planotetraspora sp. A-T 1434]MCT9934956.1 relaxase/mobilization nuclease domain-containing protein [Planotetraspora sp. A-T 1434]